MTFEQGFAECAGVHQTDKARNSVAEKEQHMQTHQFMVSHPSLGIQIP